MDQLFAMKVFRQVVDAGSFAAAGRSLNLSPVGVTRLVAALESRLGVRLLQRSTRRQVLTQAGEAYLLRVRDILQDIEEAESDAAAQTGALQGGVHVLAAPVLAAKFLAPFVVQWHERYPQVELELALDPWPQTRIEEFDLTLLMLGEGADSSLVARPLASTEWIACASPGYLDRAGWPESPGDLRQHAHLQLLGGQGSGRMGQKVRLMPLQGGPSVDVEMRSVLSSSHLEVLLDAAVAGAGIAFLSRWHVERFLMTGLLAQVLPDWMLGRFTAYAALPTRKFVPLRTRTLMDFLVGVCPLSVAA